MVLIEDLKGIEENKRKSAITCLDSLISFSDAGRLSPIITGYNWYTQLPDSERRVMFSHIHETEAYKKAMLGDLEAYGYDNQSTIKRVREKGTTHLWNPEYFIRDSSGIVSPHLRIRDKRTNQYIDLQKYSDRLQAHAEVKNSKGLLIAENPVGWELNMPFGSFDELTKLVNLFLEKSRKGDESWPGPYAVPVLLIGQDALNYEEQLPEFTKATRISLVEGGNEISFVIYNNLKRLKESGYFNKLKELGFNEEVCLANNEFIEDMDKF